jgi:hypothetical protein
MGQSSVARRPRHGPQREARNAPGQVAALANQFTFDAVPVSAAQLVGTAI